MYKIISIIAYFSFFSTHRCLSNSRAFYVQPQATTCLWPSTLSLSLYIVLQQQNGRRNTGKMIIERHAGETCNTHKKIEIKYYLFSGEINLITFVRLTLPGRALLWKSSTSSTRNNEWEWNIYIIFTNDLGARWEAAKAGLIETRAGFLMMERQACLASLDFYIFLSPDTFLCSYNNFMLARRAEKSNYGSKWPSIFPQ